MLFGARKHFWETHIMHISPERLRPWPLKAEVAPLSIVMPATMRVTCPVLRVCTLILLAGLMARQGLRAPIQMARVKMS
jgi:hypothetical protein